MKTRIEHRTAKDPEDYVRRLLKTNPQIVEARILGTHGTTPSGQIRYDLWLMVDDSYYTRKAGER